MDELKQAGLMLAPVAFLTVLAFIIAPLSVLIERKVHNAKKK
jgi:hypothetical protein